MLFRSAEDAARTAGGGFPLFAPAAQTVEDVFHHFVLLLYSGPAGSGHQAGGTADRKKSSLIATGLRVGNDKADRGFTLCPSGLPPTDFPAGGDYAAGFTSWQSNACRDLRNRGRGVLRREPSRERCRVMETPDMQSVGEALLGSGHGGYLLPFEAVSVLLLACIIGGVVVARKR